MLSGSPSHYRSVLPGNCTPRKTTINTRTRSTNEASLWIGRPGIRPRSGSTKVWSREWLASTRNAVTFSRWRSCRLIRTGIFRECSSPRAGIALLLSRRFWSPRLQCCWPRWGSHMCCRSRRQSSAIERNSSWRRRRRSKFPRPFRSWPPRWCTAPRLWRRPCRT